MPDSTDDELIRHYTLSESDLAVIQQHRGGHNCLGFAVQLCSLRHPGTALPTNRTPPASRYTADMSNHAYLGTNPSLKEENWEYAKKL